jgi:predicted TIM-barrel fold metal-dependent hydrolase
MFTVDCDTHVSDSPAALAPYCDLPWRISLEDLAETPYRYLDIPGYAPGLRLDPPIPGMHPTRSMHSAAMMRAGLDALGIDVGILFPDNLLCFAPLPNPEYATALSHAYNRWLVAEWLTEENGLYGALLACPQNPADSARQIETYAKERRIVAIYLPTAGVNPLWGHRTYDPILAAAEAADLPVVFHSVTLVSPAFPCQLDQLENHFGRQILSHSFGMMANLVSMMHTGVPARYPKLRIVFTEAGITWAPYLMWRMDKYHHEYRRVVPVLERRPSDYMREQVWVSTQPIEEPDDPTHLVEAIRHVGEDRIVFASDWPHHDFDHPRVIHRLPMPPELKRKILGENALATFTRIARPATAELARSGESGSKNADARAPHPANREAEV